MRLVFISSVMATSALRTISAVIGSTAALASMLMRAPSSDQPQLAGDFLRELAVGHVLEADLWADAPTLADDLEGVLDAFAAHQAEALVGRHRLVVGSFGGGPIHLEHVHDHLDA